MMYVWNYTKTIVNCNYYFVWNLLEVCLPKYTFTNVSYCCIFEKMYRWFWYYLYFLCWKVFIILVWYSHVWIGRYFPSRISWYCNEDATWQNVSGRECVFAQYLGSVFIIVLLWRVSCCCTLWKLHMHFLPYILFTLHSFEKNSV